MALTTTSTLSPLGLRRSELLAAVCAVSGGTHVALVVPHIHESLALAVGLALAAVATAVAAVAVVVKPGRLVSRAVAGLLSALAFAYLLSRTTGIPGPVERPEPWDPVGAPLAVLETAAAVLAVHVVRPTNPRSHR